MSGCSPSEFKPFLSDTEMSRRRWVLYWTWDGKWGRDQLNVSSELTWLNFYDVRDPVGKALAPLVSWAAPKPQDVDVDNVGQGLHAHDHWHNPNVVRRYADLIRQELGD